MKVSDKIDCMIQLLKMAKEELEYAKKYQGEDENYKYYNRNPQGTLIRENLKTVSRLSSIASKEVLLTPYHSGIEKNIYDED